MCRFQLGKRRLLFGLRALVEVGLLHGVGEAGNFCFCRFDLSRQCFEFALVFVGEFAAFFLGNGRSGGSRGFFRRGDGFGGGFELGDVAALV